LSGLGAGRWLGRVGYEEGLEAQLEAHGRVMGGGAGEILLLEHEPVFTIGRTRDRSSLGDVAGLPYPVVETNRGGQATYHGPGQLVGYVVLDLRRHGQDLHVYLRELEGLVIDLARRYGAAAGRRDGLTGVWVGEGKLASIGVGVRRWVTMHGFALNVTRESLGAFGSIVPCGLGGVEMVCLEGVGDASMAGLGVAGMAEGMMEVLV